NLWYFSEMETGLGRGACGAGGGPPNSAHVGVDSNSPFVWTVVYEGLLSFTQPDQGAVMDDQSGSPSTRTNLRIESPTINCTGKTKIVLSFNYIEGESGGHDKATVWYYNGSVWALLLTPATHDSCGSGQGKWTYDSISLPASANNNASVKIGFNWSNDTAGFDDNVLNNTFTPVVSFAVDSIALTSTPPLGVNNLSTRSNVTLYPNPNNGSFNLEITNFESGKVNTLAVYNMLGEQVYTAKVNAENTQIDLSNKASGVYMYRLINEAGTQISIGKFIVR
ncbi:MAG TPA: T9SS type A sorting domain-containing protein, partial [Bacteroidia bacterium]|nr:T9SS type A sorting domain-containing protein [Bacteroidia bacterium]